MYSENLKVNNQISMWLMFMFLIISIMIIVGGLTRLTDSGLSITQWQLFSGFLPPLNNSDFLAKPEVDDWYKGIPITFTADDPDGNIIEVHQKM